MRKDGSMRGDVGAWSEYCPCCELVLFSTAGQHLWLQGPTLVDFLTLWISFLSLSAVIEHEGVTHIFCGLDAPGGVYALGGLFLRPNLDSPTSLDQFNKCWTICWLIASVIYSTFFQPNFSLPSSHPLPFLFLRIHIVPATLSLSKLYLPYRIQPVIMSSMLGRMNNIEEVCDLAK